MINKIAHISDIHIRKIPSRNDEYLQVFDNLYKSLLSVKPDRIVITGDLVHDYIDLQGEQLIIASDFLNELSKIAKVINIRGNHDCRKKNLNRVDSVKAIVTTLHNDNVVYYDETDVFYDENIAWMVWHHGVKNNNPWNTKEGKIYETLRINGDYTAIDLFHDPINGCMSQNGFEMTNKQFYKISDFIGDYSLFGDIHKAQFLNKEKTKGYSGSLIAQDFSEGDDNFHGYFLWDIKEKKCEMIPIKNEYSFKSVDVNPYTDFDDLEIDIKNPTKFMKIRVIWKTLPETKSGDNERKVKNYLTKKYPNCLVSNKNMFIESTKIELNESITLKNINEPAIQQEIFKEYLSKIGCEESVINDVLAVDNEISKNINTVDEFFGEWNIIKFGGENFMSYEKIDVDWRDLDGMFQITGQNAVGKTTIVKFLSYILYGKTLETEYRTKFGDMRFVNNRNGATSCSGYMVFESNGEYYGIRKKTVIEKTKDGQIKGAPTTVSYYKLNNPDDELNDLNSIEKFDDDNKIKTQKIINAIIGNYDNFIRTVLTTSDTLNRILSNDMAVFIDSLLFDSGLDVFDKKLEEFKDYQKKLNEKSRITCDVNHVLNQNNIILTDINDKKLSVDDYENNQIPLLGERIVKGKTYIEQLIKKIVTIDKEIYNLNVSATEEVIKNHYEKINELDVRKNVLITQIAALRETFNQSRYDELHLLKDTLKENDYLLKLDVKKNEQEISNINYKISVLRGDVIKIEQQITNNNTEISKLRTSTKCPTCGQVIDKPEHQKHITDSIDLLTAKNVDLVNNINKIKTVDIVANEDEITKINAIIVELKNKISKFDSELEIMLSEIGQLTNEKNEVEKRKDFQVELDQLPLRVENEKLKVDLLNKKIDEYNKSLTQIELNKKIENQIVLAKQKVELLVNEENDLRENVLLVKMEIGKLQQSYSDNEKLIVKFKKQEYDDMVNNLYKKCVHRDGIPRQMLTTHIIPKINETLERILMVAPFNVWLDLDDLRPKLVYNNRPDAIIDCISASGKERTFASVVIKFALNQINVKTKPTIFLLDEVMGKLDLNGSVDEFIEILQTIKLSMKKILIVEHVHELNPDYLIKVELDEQGISSLEII
jgi:hypothetical protein